MSTFSFSTVPELLAGSVQVFLLILLRLGCLTASQIGCGNVFADSDGIAVAKSNIPDLLALHSHHLSG